MPKHWAMTEKNVSESLQRQAFRKEKYREVGCIYDAKTVRLTGMYIKKKDYDVRVLTYSYSIFTREKPSNTSQETRHLLYETGPAYIIWR